MNFTLQNIEDLKNLMSETIKQEVPPLVEKILDQRIGMLPTKEEFFSRMDKLSLEKGTP